MFRKKSTYLSSFLVGLLYIKYTFKAINKISFVFTFKFLSLNLKLLNYFVITNTFFNTFKLQHLKKN